MSTPKEIVKAFYNSDLANDPDILKTYFHPDCILHWNSSKGYSQLDYDAIGNFLAGLRASFETNYNKLSHLLADGNHVTVRYTNYVRTIEAPGEQLIIAHYITIWELKDGKLYRGHEISQLADEDSENLKSYSEIKV